jgi:energy-coupling factor transport system ATP-binding protein
VALRLTDVTCEYAPGTPMASRALEGASLTLEPGELVVVLGPTGSGKTTLLRAAAGLLAPANGTVTVDDRPVAGRGSARGAVGLVFQRPEAQFFAPSVEEDCEFGPRNLGRSTEEARADVRAALAAVCLDPDEFGPREPWGLSGGEARRAALAGVLAMRPRYLLLDEPTAGLDAAGRDAVLAAVDGVRAGAGLLVVTHDPDLFLGRADTVVILRAGRISFSGSVSSLLEELPALAAAGAAEPPEVVRAQMLARERGAILEGRLELDPDTAAAALARAAGGGSS